MLKVLALSACVSMLVLSLVGASFSDSFFIHGLSTKSDIMIGGYSIQTEQVGREMVVRLDGKEIWKGVGNELEGYLFGDKLTIKVDGNKIWPK